MRFNQTTLPRWRGEEIYFLFHVLVAHTLQLRDPCTREGAEEPGSSKAEFHSGEVHSDANF